LDDRNRQAHIEKESNFSTDDRKALAKPVAHSPTVLGVGLLVLTAVVQSPFIYGGRFRQEIGLVMAGQCAREHCSAQGRLVAGPMGPQPIVHYAQREGWTWQEYADDFPARLETYRKHGAECVVLYFDRNTPPQERQHYAPLIETLPILEHGKGPWGAGETPCEFYVLRLNGK
jgi:hypothetical protein